MSADLSPHPAAALFPMLNEWELQDLANDIRDRGQREPIAIYNGQVLDGRNRLAACNLAGVEPVVRFLEDTDIGGVPIGYVVSCNLRRRHLNPSQLAMVGIELEKLYAQEAYKRMTAGTADPRAARPQGRSRDQAASRLGISGRSVQRAKVVNDGGCEALSEAVTAGRLSVNAAERFVRAFPDKAQQGPIVAKALTTSKPAKALGNRISGGTTFDVAEIEAYDPPAKKLRNGAPLIRTKERKEAVRCLDVVSRFLNKVDLYEQHMRSLSAIREAIVGTHGVSDAA